MQLARPDLETRDDLFRELLGRTRIAEHDVIVAADVAEERVLARRADRAEDRFGQCDDQRVPAGEAIAIVERLEMIDVEVQTGEGLALLDARGHLFVDGAVARQPGERVESAERSRAAKGRVHACRELLEIEWLGHVVVGAGEQTVDLLPPPGPSGQEDHRRVPRAVVRAKPREHLVARQLGQAQVEDDELRAERERALDRGKAVVHALAAQAVQGEALSEEIAELAVVVDDEHERLVREGHAAMVRLRAYIKQMTRCGVRPRTNGSPR